MSNDVLTEEERQLIDHHTSLWPGGTKMRTIIDCLCKKVEDERALIGPDHQEALRERDAALVRAEKAEESAKEQLLTAYKEVGKWRDQRDRAEADCAAMRKGLAFASSVIKGGESWTTTCDKMIGELLTQPHPGDGHDERVKREAVIRRETLQMASGDCWWGEQLEWKSEDVRNVLRRMAKEASE